MSPSRGACPIQGFPLFCLFLFSSSSYFSSLCYSLSNNYYSVSALCQDYATDEQSQSLFLTSWRRQSHGSHTGGHTRDHVIDCCVIRAMTYTQRRENITKPSLPHSFKYHSWTNQSYLGLSFLDLSSSLSPSLGN